MSEWTEHERALQVIANDALRRVAELEAVNERLREALTLAEAVLRRNGWPTAYVQKALADQNGCKRWQ